ncbi:hypothetical protein V6N13_093691 [Hibiscus sabdariffa]|uniref:Desiccation-related protein PCC13-62 n=2 Tax=Hibiscus sabdariffa TaxID=183260 RepID=A0ABR2NGR0_9ROSI
MIMANYVLPSHRCKPVLGSTKEQFQFAVNLQIYKAEFLLRSSVGCGINDISPGLVKGPAAIGATLANLDNRTRKSIVESGLASIGHIRAIADMILLKTPLPMPQLDLRQQVYAKFFDVINVTLKPPHNPYANTDNFLFSAFYASDFLKQFYTGIMPSIVGNRERELAARIALYEAASYGVFRSLLNDRANLPVPPYTITVAKFSNLTAKITNQLGGCDVKDEGLIVPLSLGAENRTKHNVIAADANSLVYTRSALEILRILFITGDATRPGGLFPCGAEGTLYQRILALKQS